MHCRGLGGMIRKHGVELQQDRPTTAADGAVLLLWWPDRTQPVASGSTPIMPATMQLATSLNLKMEPPNLLKYLSRVLQPRCLFGGEMPCKYITTVFASQIEATSAATHIQTDISPENTLPNNQPTTCTQVRQASTHPNPHLYTASSTISYQQSTQQCCQL